MPMRAAPTSPVRADVADVVDQVSPGAGGLGHLYQPLGVRAVGGADDQQHVDVVHQALDRRLAVLRRVADVVARGTDDLGELAPQRLDDVAGVVHRQRRLGEVGDLVGIGHRQPLDLLRAVHHHDALGCLAQRADHLVVVLVADQDDRVVSRA